jgi:hypothetical protein
MFLVNIETPLGTSLQATDKVARDVEKRIAEIPDLKITPPMWGAATRAFTIM